MYYLFISNQSTIQSQKERGIKMLIQATNLSNGSIIYTGDCEEFLYSFLDSDVEHEIKLNSFCCSQSQCIIIQTDDTDYLIEKVLELICD